MLTTPLINEYFGVGVTSEPWMVSAGVEPRMGSSTDKHQFRSTGCSALAYQLKIKKNEHFLRITQRASVVLPLTRLPDVMRALRHSWLRLPQHPHTAIDHRCGLQDV